MKSVRDSPNVYIIQPHSMHAKNTAQSDRDEKNRRTHSIKC